MGCYNKDIFALKRGFYPEHLCMVCVVLLKSAVFLTFRVFGSNWNVLAVRALIDVDLLDFSASTSATPAPTPSGRRSQAGLAHSQRISGTRWVCLDRLLLFCPVVIVLFFFSVCVCLCMCERESVCVCGLSFCSYFFCVFVWKWLLILCVCVWPLLV